MIGWWLQRYVRFMTLRLPVMVYEIFHVKRREGEQMLSCDPGALCWLKATTRGMWKMLSKHCEREEGKGRAGEREGKEGSGKERRKEPVLL